MLQVSRPDESVFYTHRTVSPPPTCRLDTTEISLTLRLVQSARQYGRVAEWSIAAVLKTAEPQGSGGSNPSPSAT